MNNNSSLITAFTTNVNSDPDIGNASKFLAIFALGIGSLISGIIPRCISLRNRRRFPFIISLLLCFGAGVLLATALAHMLPDVRKVMPKNAEIFMCIGFFIIYFVDEFVHYFFGESIQHNHQHSHHPENVFNTNTNEITQIHEHNHRNYGSTNTTNSEEPNLSHNNDNETSCSNNHQHKIDDGNGSNCDVREVNARICHISHTEPCSESMTGTLGLLIALSLHSFIEGLAIGVQDTQAGVLLLLGAVACHKYVMGFCLGLEICSSSTSTLRSHIISIVVFSMGSVLGIGVGMTLIDLPTSWTQNAMPILQALAGGTLLYVTVCEVMPREKARWHENTTKKYAGLAQFLAVAIGFSLMVLINFYMDDD